MTDRVAILSGASDLHSYTTPWEWFALPTVFLAE